MNFDAWTEQQINNSYIERQYEKDFGEPWSVLEARLPALELEQIKGAI